MKICSACSQSLPKEKFSKKQWQLKCQRRCKDCIADNREMNVDGAAAPSDAPSSALSADGTELFITPEQYHEKFCLHRRRRCIAADREAKLVEAHDGEGASDEDLFKEPPPRQECPICFLAQPLDWGETTYFSCCGKTICSGCVHAHRIADNRNLCPFCRTPASASGEEYIERLKKRAEGDDAAAIFNLAGYYNDGTVGSRRNMRKAHKLWLRAGELGDARAYNSIGYAYDNGEGVVRDMNKAKYYYEVAAMMGNVRARHNLGGVEGNAGNYDRAVKHYMIAAGAGYDKSLNEIRQLFLSGHATKDDFEKALRAHKEAKDEMKSDQREAALLHWGFGTRF